MKFNKTMKEMLVVILIIMIIMNVQNKLYTIQFSHCPMTDLRRVPEM